MTFTEIIGIAAGVFTASSLIPQVVKTLKEKKAEDETAPLEKPARPGTSVNSSKARQNSDARRY